MNVSERKMIDMIQLNNMDDFHNNCHKRRAITDFIYISKGMLPDVKTRHATTDVFLTSSFILIIFAEHLF